VVNQSGTGQRYVYDAANRMVQVTDDTNSVLASYTYGEGNERLISDET
jgi:YD repeat-containing protein